MEQCGMVSLQESGQPVSAVKAMQAKVRPKNWQTLL